MFVLDVSLSLSTKFEYFLIINVDVNLTIKSRLESAGCRSKINLFDHGLTQMRERLKLLKQITEQNPQLISRSAANIGLKLRVGKKMCKTNILRKQQKY